MYDHRDSGKRSPGSEQAVKEALAMYCERFGDCRVVEIREDKVEQQTFLGEKA